MEEAKNFTQSSSPESSSLPETPSTFKDRSSGATVSIAPDDIKEFNTLEASSKEVMDPSSPMESHSNDNVAFLSEPSILLVQDNATAQPTEKPSDENAAQLDPLVAPAEEDLDIPMPPDENAAVHDPPVASTEEDLDIPKPPQLVLPVASAEEDLDIPKPLGENAGQLDLVESPENSDVAKPLYKDSAEAKIVARPSSPDDDFVSMSPSGRSLHRKFPSVEQIVAKVPSNYHTRTKSMTSKAMHNIDLSRGQIDTAAPFESVKAAVSKFGGIVDWKAHREQTVERRKFIEQELEKAQAELPSCKKQCEVAKKAKLQVLQQLKNTKRHIEGLNLTLESAKKEEECAKQDAEDAKLRVEDMAREIAEEASLTAKAQLEVARAKHAAAVAELDTANGELEQVRQEYTSLLAEKDEAIRKVEEADAASEETEKSIEELTVELLTLKQSLESAHSAPEAEDHRIEEVLAKELETLNWEEEQRWAEEQLKKLKEQMSSTKDIQSKLGEAMALLHHTRAEMEAYMKTTSEETGKEVNLEEILLEPSNISRHDIEAALTAAKKELSRLEQNIEKETEEVNSLKALATSLKSELDEEKSELEAIQKKKRMRSNSFRSFEAKLDGKMSEIIPVPWSGDENSPYEIELSLEEYYELTRKVREAEEQANMRVAAAVSQLEDAKGSESRSLNGLEEAKCDIARQKETLEIALQNAEKVEQEKLSVAHELGKWRDKQEQSYNAVESVPAPLDLSEIPIPSPEESKGIISLPSNPGLHQRVSPRTNTNSKAESESPRTSTNSKAESEFPRGLTKVVPKKKKKSFFPRALMFLFRKKTSSKTA